MLFFFDKSMLLQLQNPLLQKLQLQLHTRGPRELLLHNGNLGAYGERSGRLYEHRIVSARGRGCSANAIEQPWASHRWQGAVPCRR